MADLNSISSVVFDADGVLTDNTVYVNEKGKESLRFNKYDSFGFDFLKTKVNLLILSSEVNSCIVYRAQKLGIKVMNGMNIHVINFKPTDSCSIIKLKMLQHYCESTRVRMKNVAFVGNDINDIEIMKLVGMPLCPSDAHLDIRKISNILPIAGGQGVVRYIADFFPNPPTELYKLEN